MHNNYVGHKMFNIDMKPLKHEHIKFGTHKKTWNLKHKTHEVFNIRAYWRHGHLRWAQCLCTFVCTMWPCHLLRPQSGVTCLLLTSWGTRRCSGLKGLSGTGNPEDPLICGGFYIQRLFYIGFYSGVYIGFYIKRIVFICGWRVIGLHGGSPGAPRGSLRIH